MLANFFLLIQLRYRIGEFTVVEEKYIKIKTFVYRVYQYSCDGQLFLIFFEKN